MRHEDHAQYSQTLRLTLEASLTREGHAWSSQTLEPRSGAETEAPACNIQAAAEAGKGQPQGGEAAMSDDIMADWRMRAGSALDDLRPDKKQQFDALNIQVDQQLSPG